MNNYLKFFNYTYVCHYLTPLGKFVHFTGYVAAIILLSSVALFIYSMCKDNWFVFKLAFVMIIISLLGFVFVVTNKSTMDLTQQGQQLENRCINQAHQEYPYLVVINGRKYLSKTQKGFPLFRLHDSNLIKYYSVVGKTYFVLDSKNYLKQTMIKKLNYLINGKIRNIKG